MKILQGGVGLAAWCAGVALAQTLALPALEPVGRVKTLSGMASIHTQASTVAAALGTPVFQGSVIQTEKNASVGLSFKDGTVLSLGADTQLVLDAYAYDPNQGHYSFAASLGKGVLNYLSGAIAKARPQAVSVKTPSAVIGVRGTNFVLKTEEAP